MKMIFPLFVWVLCSLGHCDAQTEKPDEKEISPIIDTLWTWTENDRKKWLGDEDDRGKVIDLREKQIAALREDLTAPWSALIVAKRTDSSCTGNSYKGLRISRDGDHFTGAPWMERGDGWSATGGKEYTGTTQQLTATDVKKLISEAALFYLAATLSESVIEKVGPRPPDAEKQGEWMQRYLAAGGNPEEGDYHWIDIRVVTANGVKCYRDMWERWPPYDFSRWVKTFGEAASR